jgi:hypothetical protein
MPAKAATTKPEAIHAAISESHRSQAPPASRARARLTTHSSAYASQARFFGAS